MSLNSKKVEAAKKAVYLRNLGRTVTKLMGLAGIEKQKDLAAMTGSSPPYISQLCAGQKAIDVVNIPKFAKALGVPSEVLVTGIDYSLEELKILREVRAAFETDDRETIQRLNKALKQRKK